MCRELGFDHAQFDRWYHHRNESAALSISQPGCIGDEERLLDCLDGSRVNNPMEEEERAGFVRHMEPRSRLVEKGRSVCDYHQDIGIWCHSPRRKFRLEYWRGIHFRKALYTIEFDSENRRVNSSRSVLEHVEIDRAGMSTSFPEWSSAIESFGVAPILSNITIRDSFGNGLNLTSDSGPIAVNNVKVGMFFLLEPDLPPFHRSTPLVRMEYSSTLPKRTPQFLT